MRESKTLTGKTVGNSEGERFLEDQSKQAMRLWIQSRLSFPSCGHDKGSWSSGDEDKDGAGGFCSELRDEVAEPLMAVVVVTESDGGGDCSAESVAMIIVDEKIVEDESEFDADTFII